MEAGRSAGIGLKAAGVRRVCLVPQVSGVGGMVSFRQRLSEGLARRAVQVTFSLDDRPFDAVLVIGGTRQLVGLLRARRAGIPIVQRLDGMNWLQRLLPRSGVAGWRHYFRAEYGNRLLSIIRARLATRIVYQSEFSRNWWERVYGKTPVPARIIYNGVDLNVYNPLGERHLPLDRYRLLLVEGSLMGGYEQGLQVAVELASGLAGCLRSAGSDRILELVVVGRVPQSLKEKWEAFVSSLESSRQIRLNWTGQVPSERIPVIDRSAHLLYSADINAACPNSVIEALACGLPVVAFDTGALPELVQDQAGKVVPYGGDPWKLDPPHISALAASAWEILQDLPSFQLAARQRAEAAFDLESMIDHYLGALSPD
jgi:glycosyltransferase involved in cell wall biosynthesis